MTYIASPSSCSADFDGVWLCDPIRTNYARDLRPAQKAARSSIVSPKKSSGEPLPLEKERGSNKLIIVNYAKILDSVKMYTSP
jgi:hypothetical protein